MAVLALAAVVATFVPQAREIVLGVTETRRVLLGCPRSDSQLLGLVECAGLRPHARPVERSLFTDSTVELVEFPGAVQNDLSILDEYREHDLTPVVVLVDRLVTHLIQCLRVCNERARPLLLEKQLLQFSR